MIILWGKKMQTFFENIYRNNNLSKIRWVYGSFLFESQGPKSPWSYFSNKNINNYPCVRLSVGTSPALFHFILTTTSQVRNCGSKQVRHLPSITYLLSSRARILLLSKLQNLGSWPLLVYTQNLCNYASLYIEKINEQNIFLFHKKKKGTWLRQVITKNPYVGAFFSSKLWPPLLSTVWKFY